MRPGQILGLILSGGGSVVALNPPFVRGHNKELHSEKGPDVELGATQEGDGLVLTGMGHHNGR